MHYKTIVLELLLQRPNECGRLKKERKMLDAVNSYASMLRTNHLAIKQAMLDARPGSDPTQIAYEAMEIAVKEMEEALPSESDQADEDSLSPEQAMNFLRRHSPHA